MSIIYNALQKTQKNREKKHSSPSSHRGIVRSDWISRFLMMVIAVLAVIAIIAYYPRVKEHLVAMAETNVHSEQMKLEDAFRHKHTLNGVFVSDNNKVAMINGQYYHVGDEMEGMLLYHICDRDVRLRNDKLNITLEAPV